MSTGTKLQEAAEKVNKQLGLQDADVTFRVVTHSGKASIAAAGTQKVNDLVIESGLKVSRVQANEIRTPGVMEINDLRLEIPGNLVTEERLQKCEILYKNERFRPYQIAPSKFISGVAVKWKVLARRQK